MKLIQLQIQPPKNLYVIMPRNKHDLNICLTLEAITYVLHHINLLINFVQIFALWNFGGTYFDFTHQRICKTNPKRGHLKTYSEFFKKIIGVVNNY
jgi:hypothetical protein